MVKSRLVKMKIRSICIEGVDIFGGMTILSHRQLPTGGGCSLIFYLKKDLRSVPLLVGAEAGVLYNKGPLREGRVISLGI